LQTGGNISLVAGRDFALVDGTALAAGGDAALKAAEDILIAAATDTSSFRSSSMSVSLSFSEHWRLASRQQTDHHTISC
jgi:Hemagglutinin repeat